MNEYTLIYDDGEFRKYAPVIAKRADGSVVVMQLCEERDPQSGRWEGFFSVKAIVA